MKVKLAIIFLGLLCLSGCYSHSPIETIKTQVKDYFKPPEYEKLYVACCNEGNEQALIEAINEGADINKFKYHNYGTVSPVIWSSHCQNNPRFMRTILKYDIDPNMVDTSGMTVFAESMQYSRVYDKLLNSNPDLDFVADSGKYKGMNIVQYALEKEISCTRIKEIIDKGAPVSAENIQYIINKVNYLIEGEHTVDISNIYLLHEMIENYSGSDIDLNIRRAYTGQFADKGKKIDEILLYGIAGYCDKDILASCIDNEDDIDFLLDIAVMANNMDNVKYLIDRGAHINAVNDFDIDAIYYAIEFNNYDMVKFILSKSKLNIDKYIRYAVINNNLQIVNLLLDNGANLYNKEAFEEALFNDYFSIVKTFVNRSYNLKTLNHTMSYPYSVFVCGYCDLDMVKYIHQYTEPMTKEELQQAMYFSATTGNIEVLKYLKDLGADLSIDNVDESNNSRFDSQLITAVRLGYYDIVKYLVENGCTAKNYNVEEVEALIKYAKESNDIYTFLKNQNIIDE